jgi:hypothetical protein
VKIVKDTSRIISIAPAAPGIVAIYADYEGGEDIEDPVLAWGVVDKTEEGFNYTVVAPLCYNGDTGTLEEASDCSNFIGVRGGPIPAIISESSIQSNRESFKRREEARREAHASKS